ncbi:MAG: DnaJ domain-containing protein, partial [Paludibacteraceae bacterium]|nr:DnaJ domain-containing protein [Paludibacteraceae bacterium]
MAKVFLIFALFFIVVKSYLLAVACWLIGLILDLYSKINSEEREKREKEKWEKEEKKWSEAEEREKGERRRREAEEKREKAEKEQREAEEKRKREEDNRNKEKYKDYRYCILVLLAKIMKADGDTMECELDRVKSTIRRYYKTKEEQYEAFNTFKSILDDNNYFSIWSSLNTQFDYTAKSELIMELLAVAYSDNNLKYAEEKEILHIVSQLRITSDEYKSIYSIFIEKYNKGFYSENKSQNENRKDHYYKKQEEHRKSDHSKTNKEYSHNSRQISSKEKNAYAILGVESNATDEEIKKAYRAMAIKCHPDNASNLGDEAIRQATESMKQINMAWETVKMARGIK